MSVAGIDFGNLSLLIGQTSKGGVDVILNESSNRQTATYVSIQGKQRFIGDSGAAMARSNITNTISLMKLLVGRRFKDPDVQTELSKSPFKAVELSNGGVGISILYNDEPLIISAEHAMAMMLVKAKDTSAKANGNLNIADSVLAVPQWFTESQRRGILQACEIASLNCLKVTNESSAIALSYGIFKSAKKLFSETDPQHIMFVDIGYTSYCVTIVDFIQENMKVLSTVCDRDLGGRNFDDVIIEFLAESFQKKTGIDVRKNIKAILKLQAAAEKAKKTLSPAGVNEVNISVECLADDKDLSVLLTRDEFESRANSLVGRLKQPIELALEEANLKREQLTEIEIIGGTSRVNIVKRVLGEILGTDPNGMNYGLKTTMNADEAVARGCALQCAMLSSRVKVKPFHITDKLAYGIIAHFDATTSSSSSSVSNPDEVDMKGGSSSVALYVRGDDIPHKPRRLTFRNKINDFTVTLTYDEISSKFLPPGESKFLSKFIIIVPSSIVNLTNPGDIRVTWNLDKNGFVYVQNAQLLEEVMNDNITSPTTNGEENKDITSETKENEIKKRFKKTDLEVITESPGLSKDHIKEALELEASMFNEDRLITETADKRNELESYIYSMRDKLDDDLKEYSLKDEKDKLKLLLTESEDWLYGDGFDSTKSEYTRKIDTLRLISDKIEKRYNEAFNRPNAIDGLKKQLELCKSFASKYGEDYAHITEDERDQLRKEIRLTEEWMYDMISKQGELKASMDPILTVDSIDVKRKALFKNSNPIINKPKPKPNVVPAETKSEPSTQSSSTSNDKDGKETNNESEPMDVDKDTETKDDEAK